MTPPRGREPVAGARALDDWLERGWIELEPGADKDELAEKLEALLVSEMKTGALLDALLELDGVEDLYCTEDEAKTFRRAW